MARHEVPPPHCEFFLIDSVQITGVALEESGRGFETLNPPKPPVASPLACMFNCFKLYNIIISRCFSFVHCRHM